MNILSEILGAQGGQVVDQLGKQFELNQDQTQNAIGQLLPALTRGLRGNMASEEGLGSLLTALGKGDHGRYLDNPSTLGDQSTVVDGNGILAHILGSKQRSREVASEAAQSTGLDLGILKKMLPMVAGLMMGSLNKQASSTDMLNQMSAGSADLGGLLSQLAGSGQQSQLGGLAKFLDLDGDGSVADDLLGLAKKFF
ncbi:MAG: DUF937 domain-containing protein [Gammaproteobacteria bacterium]|nr:DUF937 domain-containing protein [Gammaproteobacteria bacterium]